MSSQEIETAISEINDSLVNVLTTLDSRMDELRLDEIVEHGETLQSANLGQRPERCIEDALIWPILETLGFEVTPRPYYPVGKDEERPDFRIDNLSETVIGENKSLNRFDAARSDIESYLDTRRYEYGIATDGFRWGMYAIETDDSGRAELVEVVEEQEITPAVRRIARDRGLVNYNEEIRPENSIEGILGRFYQTFNHYSVRRATGGLTEFYDLYLEAISGEGEYEQFESNLVAAMDAPDGSSKDEKLAFSALLIDRLAFLKLLIDRGVLDNIALHEQWNEHNQGLNRFRGSFYSQFLRPLFYDALSESSKDRAENLRRSFRDVPSLTGGLFEPILPGEQTYDVPDDAMKPVLARFIEGEGQTLINEAADGSLLRTYTEEYENRDLAGDIPRFYSSIVDAYGAELDHVESEIERTLRAYTQSGVNQY